MQSIKDIAHNVLVDMLAEHTARYSQLLNAGDRSEEFDARKNMIKLIQDEINARRGMGKGDKSVKGP